MLVKEPPAGSVWSGSASLCPETCQFRVSYPSSSAGSMVFPLTCAVLWGSKQPLTSAPVAASSSVTIPCLALQKLSVYLVSLGPVLAGPCLESAWAI